MTQINTDEIIEKAKNTPYKHKCWFSEGVTVHHAISYFVDSGDFRLQLKQSIRYARQVAGAPPVTTYHDLLQYCLKNVDTHWKYLSIKYCGSEGGTDTGKLKVLTFVALSGNNLLLA